MDAHGGTDRPVVTTTTGAIGGEVVDHGVSRFLGVPYAAPPLGELRFLPPQPHHGWDDVRECTRYGDSAMQRGGRGGSPGPLGSPEHVGPSEDCLVLNVWSPDLAGSAPVMVWLHGGG